jgi:hypothetical protein
VPCGTRPLQSTSWGSVGVRSKDDLVAADSGESAANGRSLRDLLGANASHGHDLEHEREASVMGEVSWGWFTDQEMVAHLGLPSPGGRPAGAVCGAEIIDPLASGSSIALPRCAACSELHDDLAAGRQLRAWRERGSVFACQQASDVVTVHLGALEIHVWRHPDGALIEALDGDPRRHAAYISICRDPEEAGARAVMLALSHGPQCAERPMWPVMDTRVEAATAAPE